MYTLTLPDQSAHDVTLPNLLAQSPYTILYFYPKDDTPGCTKEAKDFSDLLDQFNQLSIQVVGVSRDDHQSHCDFITKYDLTPRYLSDPELTLHQQFGARGEKNNYGKIVTGVIRSTVLLNKEGTVLKQRNNVKATGHAARILKEVQSLVQ